MHTPHPGLCLQELQALVHKQRMQEAREQEQHVQEAREQQQEEEAPAQARPAAGGALRVLTDLPPPGRFEWDDASYEVSKFIGGGLYTIISD